MCKCSDTKVDILKKNPELKRILEIGYLKMRKVFDFFGEAIKSCNVFTAPVNLRYKLDPDYNTFTGGVVSIGLMILLVSVFFNAWLQLLNKEAISSSTEVVRQFDPEYMAINSDEFMFAIGSSGLNLSDFSQRKYFTLKMKKYVIQNIPVYSKTATDVNLEPCSQNSWEQLGQEFVQTFQRQKLSSFVCVPRNTTIEMAGKFTSETFIYYKISFQKCTGSNCRNQSQIDAWISANTSFQMSFYYSNTLLNPDQKQPLSMIFQDKDYTMFSPTMSTSTNLYVGNYAMQTDESIFPWTDSQTHEGFILNRAEKESWTYINTPSEPYCKLYIRKSNVQLEIQRQFRKLDDMLSYIGGLFGIIAVAFGFVMNYYSQCSFELEMCQNIFDYHNKKRNIDQQSSQNDSQFPTQKNQGKDQTGWEANLQKPENLQKVIEPKDFGFIDFIFHIIFIPLKKICSLKWRRMQIYEESLEEMRCKLDVSQLLQKLSFYDRSVNALFDENQLKLLYLQEKFNFQEIREEREMLGMRKDIVANLFGLMTDKIPKVQENSIVQHKKTLKQIAIEHSRKRLHSFMRNSVQIFDLFAQLGAKKSSQQQDGINLPSDIKTALKKLDEKIDKGDLTSIRIYNGLQYEILQAFEKSKMKKTNHRANNKKFQKRTRVNDERKDNDNLMIENMSPNNSATSIYNLNLN